MNVHDIRFPFPVLFALNTSAGSSGCTGSVWCGRWVSIAWRMTGRTPHELGMTRNGKVDEIDAKYPGEMVNLASSDKHRNVLNRHRKLLRQWIRKTDDVFDHVPVPD